jgi:conjugal transfer pilus assembly protein TraW
MRSFDALRRLRVAAARAAARAHARTRVLALGLALGVALAPGNAAMATDLGTIGPTYGIGEQDMLEWIEKWVTAKVDSGEALRYQQEQAERIKRKLAEPDAIKAVSKAQRGRTRYFDPTFVAAQNVTDEAGKILVAAGTTINPLDRINLTRPLIFFDARDPNQVAFAKKYIDGRAGLAKPVLVGGSYFELMRLWRTPVYFDQQGSLTRRFGIEHVPAIVAQERKRLRIDEIAL